VIKFVSDLRHVGDFIRVNLFSAPIILIIGLETMGNFCVIFRVADDSEIRVSVMMFNATLKNN
jgi:hypothetical protein